MTQLAVFLQQAEGQDMVEYALILAFVCLTGAALYFSVGNLTSSIWQGVNSGLAASNQAS